LPAAPGPLSPATRTGAESLLATAAGAGVELCFANPGTTEMPLVLALDRTPGLRAVLGLHETVVTGAADGYARIAGKPALTLLHLGPGLGNGIANLHNARRARTPLVNMIGEHATWHQDANAPLATDIEALAGAVSGWVRRSRTADGMGEDMAAALEAAMTGNGQVASLILAHDLQLAETTGTAAADLAPRRAGVPAERIEAAAQALRGGGRNLLLLGYRAVTASGLKAAARVAEATGASLMTERSVGTAERGAGLPAPRAVPYFPEQAEEALAGFETVVFAGAEQPVAFFGWPGHRSRHLPEGCRQLAMAGPDDDVVGALESLAEALDAAAYRAPAAPARPEPPQGPLTSDALCRAIAALQPEGAIVVNESITSGWSYHGHSAGAPRFTQLALTGGAIGCGPSCAAGAAVAAPGRKVINLQADGSGAYALQAFWTQARESLDIVTVIAANREYRILLTELQRAGVNQPGPKAQDLADLTRPAIGWCDIAKGFGIPAETADSADALVAALGRALASPGPALIEALVE
jgi:acetolactate synthase-1/2/3 large subunit